MAFGLRKKILNWVKPLVEVPVAGLDISDQSVKYFKFRSNASLEVEFFGEVPIREGIIVNGEIRKEEELKAFFESWLSREGKKLRSCFVVASLPEEKSFLHFIQLPKVEREKVGSAVRWEIEANIPLSPDELIYDQEVIEPSPDHFDHLDVIITAFPKNIVESYVRVLKGVGLTLSALELESQAVARAIVSDIGTHSAKIIVDMGRMRTGIMVISGGAIIFTKTVEVGGKIFEENIARAMGVSLEKAGLIKKETGLDKKAYEGKVFSALMPACTVLADEIKRAFAYYRDGAGYTHGVRPDVDLMLLAGGDASLFGLATYLSSALKIQTRLSDPFELFRKKSEHAIPPMPKNQALAFATAIGLALRGIR